MGMVRTVSAVFGVIYVLVGLVAFVLVSGGQGDLLGLFRVNVAHDIAHIAFGAILLWGATSTSAAVLATRVVGAILVVLGVLGFFDPIPDTLPLGGNDIWLHLATGVILLAAGFMAEPEPSVA